MSIRYFDKTNNFEKYKDVKSILIIGDNALEKPFFTIVIPTYKRANLFTEALKSAVNQEYVGEYEILIIDNEPYEGIINETEKIVRSFSDERINYYRNERNIGMFGNWNRCIELAKSNWICMLHDDDYLDLRYLYEIHQILISRPDAGIISSRFNVIEHNTYENKYKLFAQRGIKKILSLFQKNITHIKMVDYLFGYSCPIVGSCFSRSQAIEIGGFDEDFYPSADYFFIAKFTHYFRNVYFYRKSIYNYRIFANESISIAKETWFLDDYNFISFLIDTNNFRYKQCLDYLNLSILKDRIEKNNLKKEVDYYIKYSFVDTKLNEMRFTMCKKIICKSFLSVFMIYKYYFRL